MSLDSDSPAYILAALAAGTAFKVLAGYWISRNADPDSEYRLVGRVSALYCYPVKSFRGIQVDEGDCTPVGLSCFGVTDRHFTVATPDGVYLTQRQEPTMALIRVQVKGQDMQLDAPGMESITVPINPTVTKEMLSKVTVKTDTVPSVDCGDEVAAWLCHYFNRSGLRLHFSAPSLEKRQCQLAKKMWNHPAQPGDLTALSDYCGYMLLSNPSLAALNSRLTNPVPISNFRANIIVDSCHAFDEDNWISVRIGDVQLRALDNCTRCILVTVDQEKGVKDMGEEPLSTLKTFRLKEPYGPKPAFGVNYTLDKPGKIRVGDLIYARSGQLKVSRK
ncbi:mitochondrial amidoxime-reducing component 1-like [Babylonia areolata]|uniref:mitochondrial amidoxime-reducing component 1-like n=1 Tax=Babylonia areolata TaxID=304850 RepID=UPI003FD2CCE5